MEEQKQQELTEEQKIIRESFIRIMARRSLNEKGEEKGAIFISVLTRLFILNKASFEVKHYGETLVVDSSVNPYLQLGLTLEEAFQLNHIYGILIGFKQAFETEDEEFIDALINQALNEQYTRDSKQLVKQEMQAINKDK